MYRSSRVVTNNTQCDGTTAHVSYNYRTHQIMYIVLIIISFLHHIIILYSFDRGEALVVRPELRCSLANLSFCVIYCFHIRYCHWAQIYFPNTNYNRPKSTNGRYCTTAHSRRCGTGLSCCWSSTPQYSHRISRRSC